MCRKDRQEKEDEKIKMRTMRTTKTSLQDKVASQRGFEYAFSDLDELHHNPYDDLIIENTYEEVGEPLCTSFQCLTNCCLFNINLLRQFSVK